MFPDLIKSYMFPNWGRSFLNYAVSPSNPGERLIYNLMEQFLLVVAAYITIAKLG